MRYTDEELFDHKVTAWTVGQLRAALEGLPDEMPVRVIPADEPGGDIAGADQVVTGAAPWADVDVGPTGSAGHVCMPGATAADVRAELDTGELQPDHFEISCEFPSGRYYRARR
jgi:Family of unknown function (DUF6225)